MKAGHQSGERALVQKLLDQVGAEIPDQLARLRHLRGLIVGMKSEPGHTPTMLTTSTKMVQEIDKLLMLLEAAKGRA